MKISWRINDGNVFEKNPIQATELPEGQMYQTMDRLKEVGVDAISFSDGEMFAMNNVGNVLKASSEKGFKTAVTTNARFLTKEKFDKCKKYLNKLTFTLDFENDKDNKQSQTYIQYLTEMIGYINKVEPKMDVEVNTVVCLENMAYLLKMSKELETVKIKNWNLYEFSLIRGRLADNFGKTEAPSVSYKEVIRFLRERSQLPICDFAKDNIQSQAVIVNHKTLKCVYGDKETCLLDDVNRSSLIVLGRAIDSATKVKLKHCNIENNKIKPIEMLY